MGFILYVAVIVVFILVGFGLPIGCFVVKIMEIRRCKEQREKEKMIEKLVLFTIVALIMASPIIYALYEKYYKYHY